MKYKTYSASVESMQEEIDTLRRQLAEAEERIATLEAWASGPNGVRWYIDKLALAEQDKQAAVALLQEAFDSIIRAAALAGVDPMPEPTTDSIGGRIAAFIATNRAAIAAGEGKDD